MKNAKHESKRLNAIRQLASGKLGDWRRLKEGVFTPHLYEEPYRPLSYWDDFSFRVNRQWVSVAWVHPRMALIDHIEDMAHDAANEVATYKHRNFIEDMTPNYVKVGRSRKKHHTSTWNSNPDNDAYFEAYKAARLAILKGERGMDIAVPANQFSIEQMDYGKFVSIRSPVEIITERDAIDYAHQVKAALSRSVVFPYDKEAVYTLTDYHNDLKRTGQEIT